MKLLHRLFVILLVLALLGAACGGGDPSSEPASADEAPGVRVVSADEGASILADPPEGLVVLDVRTPVEFDEAHLEGATLVDIYEPDFTERIDQLDRDVPYLLYCRSGNRSEQARTLMAELGFADVADVAGGIQAWVSEGHPVVSG
ncbi:MAG: rhodanese-like domain-containing protein [Acidimicrobiales bacterium]